MGYRKTQQGNNVVTSNSKWKTDDYDDLATILSDEGAQFGDTVYIFDGTHKGEIYMLNSSGTWVMQ